MNTQKVRPIYILPTLDQAIAAHLEHALSIFNWNMTRTAAALAVDRRTLYRMVERHHVKRPSSAPPPESSDEQQESEAQS